ncbi:MAG: polysaccharide deacetylase 2 family uncharacterized protein YibQ [Alphaproteobacteria bacterium]
MSLKLPALPGLPSIPLPGWLRGKFARDGGASESDIYDGVDDLDEDAYLKPSAFQEKFKKNLPLITLSGAWVLTAGIFLGIFLWLHLTADHVMDEVRAHRPNMTMQVTAPKTGAFKKAVAEAHDAPDNSSETHETPKPKKSNTVLVPHPDPALIEKTNVGVLPIIGKGGRMPWRVYSRPFNVLEQRPRVAFVLTGLGVSRTATQSAIRDLPPEVTFAFAPYAKELEKWIKDARDAGHEVLLDAPMESTDFPRSDSGPNGLLVKLGDDRNIRRLHWLMSRFTGYVGVTNILGGRFTSDKKAMRPILLELKRRGLMFLDGNADAKGIAGAGAAGIGMAHAVNDRIIDTVANSAAIDFRLSEIDLVLKSKKSAIAMGRAYPVTIRRLKRWLSQLSEKGFVLAPLSALAIKPK